MGKIMDILFGKKPLEGAAGKPPTPTKPSTRGQVPVYKQQDTGVNIGSKKPTKGIGNTSKK